MAIKSGRLGNILYDPAGVTPVALVAVNAFKLDIKTGKIKVTCFQDLNEKYVPGMKDISGSLGGFWDSNAVELFDAADAEVPGMLKLIPNTSESTFFWSGLAYMDASIDCKVDGVPTVNGTFMAADDWTREPIV